MVFFFIYIFGFTKGMYGLQLITQSHY